MVKRGGKIIAIRTTLDAETHKRARIAAAVADVSLAEVMRRALVELAETGRVPREVKRIPDK